MFYLPNGDGAQVAVSVPSSLPGGAAPAHLVLSAEGISPVDLQWSTDASDAWHTEDLDWGRSPTAVPIPAGAKAVKFRREQGKTDPVLVTGDWA